ncbi:MAG: NADH-ubiquinone oxidoreductase subunit E family protein [Sulfurospirillaceae bacterium]|nr:NADH-ubiquinone oxidoreductase subunit E family protein [Sulfurospirillaceae bacterium]MDD3462008.1 NADH-ubiquinone oxidoreductase subunit E family protein [Sulfurospirillaceae bacterium]
MQRYDLRHLKDDFYSRMSELVSATREGEVSVFIFEIGDFSSVQKSIQLAKEQNCEVMNSLKFNEVDWTMVVKKMPAGGLSE